MDTHVFTDHAMLWLIVTAQVLLIARVLLRPYRDPSSRVAWIVVVTLAPVLGMIGYLLFGEVRLANRQVQRLRAVLRQLPRPDGHRPVPFTPPPEPYAPLFEVGHSISGFLPEGGNRARLYTDSAQTINAMVADIDAAQAHVHVYFYIWLDDKSGRRMADALVRAAARGVTCRVMADALGSREFVRSPHWTALRRAGVKLAEALPRGWPLVELVNGRLDVRNHRKLVIVDNHITYCGSQNCADADFHVKPRFAPWVDATLRLTGPVARQNQHLFISDWMTHEDEDLAALLEGPLPAPDPDGFPAQVIGTGPNVRFSAMPEMFTSLMFTARRELVITTPYYVPNGALHGALCAAANRGVDTTLIVPARNDSRVVSAASRSYYRSLLAAGVKLYEFEGGLLHAKTLTLDGLFTLMGSANLDRRSFDLNYENSILLCDTATTRAVREAQQGYIAGSRRVTPAMVGGWPVWRRLWHNTIAMFGPVL
ncbi:MAG: phosphatidylserine/phosphatidylglycerophosphate/cardiolipin synthase [Moraxellaceae bacterium]|jgi:cardiolipin synthase|nr:phosphatidylserine/phosphatidylglycerophosphate/cardiolipin synthase [Moraxellaceae bacterium]